LIIALALYARAISCVRSWLPQSTTMISSATPSSDRNARGKLRSSFNVIRQAERRFITLRKVWNRRKYLTTLVERAAGKSACWRLRRQVAFALLFLKVHVDQASTDAELGAILEHRGAHPLFFIECSVGGIHVFQINVGVAHFQQAVMPGDFRIVQGHVCPLAAQNHAGFCKRVTLPFGRTGENAENNFLVSRKLQSRIGWRQVQI